MKRFIGSVLLAMYRNSMLRPQVKTQGMTAAWIKQGHRQVGGRACTRPLLLLRCSALLPMSVASWQT